LQDRAQPSIDDLEPPCAAVACSKSDTTRLDRRIDEFEEMLVVARAHACTDIAMRARTLVLGRLGQSPVARAVVDRDNHYPSTTLRGWSTDATVIVKMLARLTAHESAA
jgi:hypothetical protein